MRLTQTRNCPEAASSIVAIGYTAAYVSVGESSSILFMSTPSAGVLVIEPHTAPSEPATVMPSTFEAMR